MEDSLANFFGGSEGTGDVFAFPVLNTRLPTSGDGTRSQALKGGQHGSILYLWSAGNQDGSS